MSDIITTSLQSISEELKKKAETLQDKELEAQKRHVVECAAELAEIVNSGKVELTAEELAIAASLVEDAGKWTGEPVDFFELFRYWGTGSSPCARGEHVELFNMVKPYTKAFQEKLEAEEQKKRVIVDEILDPESGARWNGSQYCLLGGRHYFRPSTDYRKDEMQELSNRLAKEYEEGEAAKAESSRKKAEEERKLAKAEEESYRVVCKHYFGLEGEDFEQVTKASLNAKIREDLREEVPYERHGTQTSEAKKVPAQALVRYKTLISDITKAAKALAKELGFSQKSVKVERDYWGNYQSLWTVDFTLSIGNIRSIRFTEVVLLPEDYHPESLDY